mgnify:CR=1 FL=1
MSKTGNNIGQVRLNVGSNVNQMNSGQSRTPAQGQRRDLWGLVANVNNDQKTNRSGNFRQKSVCVGVFVTRLHVNTTPDLIADYVKYVTGGLVVKPQSIVTRNGGYKSICIRGNRHTVQILLDPRLWSAGSMVKGYFEKKQIDCFM